MGGKKFEPSRAYKNYMKGLKREWNRDPQRKEAVEGRNKLIYNKTKIA
jgi:hypothetical protein